MGDVDVSEEETVVADGCLATPAVGTDIDAHIFADGAIVTDFQRRAPALVAGTLGQPT